MIEAITAGDVDAIFTWEPYVQYTMTALGENAYGLPTGDLKVTDWVAVTMKEYAERNPMKLEAYLRALAKATQFIRSNPEESITLVSAKSGIDKTTVSSMWEKFSFGLYLNESMLLNLEDQARWINKNGKSSANIPNILNLIHTAPLKKTSPEAVTLVQ